MRNYNYIIILLIYDEIIITIIIIVKHSLMSQDRLII